MTPRRDLGRSTVRRFVGHVIASPSLLLLLTLSGCSAPPVPLGDLTMGPLGRARFIVEDPQVVVGRDHFLGEREVFDWHLRGQAEADRWAAAPGVSVIRQGDEGLRLHAPRGGAIVEREVELDARSLSVIEVEVVGGGPFVELSWASDDGPIDDERTIRMARGSRATNEPVAYRFVVGDHPAWRGTIRALRLRCVGPDIAWWVKRLTGFARTLRSNAAQEADGVPWKVELGHDLRNAYRTQPGQVIERDVRVPDGATLRFAVGVEEAVRDATMFRARVVPVGAGAEAEAESGNQAAADDATSTGVVAFERRVAPRELGETSSWIDVEIPLTLWAGQRVRLRLETAADNEAPFEHGFALWANPEVVVPIQTPPPSVLLVSMDTLRADRLSGYGYDRETSPRLDAWAMRRAVTFRHAVAAAPWTLPSHVSMFTGLDATHHGINHDVGSLDSAERTSPHTALETLAERLRRAGYATGAFTGGAYLHPQFGFAQGFDVYGYWPDRGRDRDELSTGVARALAWIERHRDQPSFFFLHSYEVHDPYRAHAPYVSRVAPSFASTPPSLRAALQSPAPDSANGFRQVSRHVMRGPGPQQRPAKDDDLALINALYDSGVMAMDDQLGGLLEYLEVDGLDTRWLTVVTSDHGEALGEEGRVGHVDLHDVELMVPLMVAPPGDGVRSVGTVIEDQVRSIDIVPTILELAGQPSMAGLDGVSLQPLMDGERDHVPRHAWSYAASSNRGLSMRYGNRLKLIVPNSVWPPRGGPELYDLTRDPGETSNQFATTPTSRAEALVAEARAHLKRARGLELTMSNRGPGTLRGALLGAMVRPVATKSPDLDCDCLRWVTMGENAFTIPPGTTFSVRFEKIFGRRLTVRGTLDGAPRGDFDHTFDVDGLEAEAAAYRYADGRWRSKSPVQSASTGTGFVVRWRGDQSATEGPAEIDSEVREQLEALGYIQ